MKKSMLMQLCQHYADPCGFTNVKSKLYANHPLRDLLNIPRCVDREEQANAKPSAAMAVFQQQEKQARDQQSPLSVINIFPYGYEQLIQPYLFDFFPLFNTRSQCVGTFCYARPFPFFSLLECVDNKSPHPVAVQQPKKIFTEKEWEVIFFLLNRLSNKEIAKRLHLSHRTIENKLQIIYDNLGVHNSNQLRNFCELEGIDNYIPSKFLSTGSHVISVSARS